MLLQPDGSIYPTTDSTVNHMLENMKTDGNATPEHLCVLADWKGSLA